jgi:hypothetical protein
MALRVLSGLIWVDPSRVPQGGGFARITFNPFELADATDGVELRKRTAIGAHGTFLSRPASIVAARQFQLGSGHHVVLGINDKLDADEITVRWRGGRGGNVHEEIPLLIVGEVADADPPAEGETITIRLPPGVRADAVRGFLEGFSLAVEPAFEPRKPKRRKKKATRKARSKT